MTRWPPGRMVGSAVSMPSTSVQIWISSAPMPAPTMEAVKSDPPRPSVVVTPSSVEPMKPPITTTASLGQRRHGGGQARVGLRKIRRGLGVALVGDDDVARIEMHGVHAEMAEGQRDDVAGEALAVAGNGVDGARRQFAEHGQSLDQLGEFLEMLVERAVEFGAVARAAPPGGLRASGNRAGREAGGCTRRACRRWRPRRWPAACWWSCPWPKPPPPDAGPARALTMPATRSMAAADSTDVPPNFITIISPASLPSASARHSARPRRRRRAWYCG